VWAGRKETRIEAEAKVDFCGTTRHTHPVVTSHPQPSAKNAKGNVEYERFTSLVDQVLSVPHSVVQQRIEEHRKAVAKNPHRRGPKPKKSS
jgi:hypothetical protein